MTIQVVRSPDSTRAGGDDVGEGLEGGADRAGGEGHEEGLGLLGTLDDVAPGLLERRVPAQQGETTAIIAGMQPGTYAAQVYFDENDNDQLDRNFIGIPREGVGFSNNPSFTFHAPSFADSAFIYDGVSGAISVRLRYY